ncbi:recombinase family protein [bacterium]|nr:recombinase family protein [bacterium]
MIYAYYRVSTDKQDYTCQKFGVMEFCHQRGLAIDKEIIDEGDLAKKLYVNLFIINNYIKVMYLSDLKKFVLAGEI